MSEFTHRPVLLDECIEGLNIRGEGVYLDGTLGRAGHSEQIVRRLTSGRLICVDRDRAALDAAREVLAALSQYGLLDSIPEALTTPEVWPQTIISSDETISIPMWNISWPDSPAYIWLDDGAGKAVMISIPCMGYSEKYLAKNGTEPLYVQAENWRAFLEEYYGTNVQITGEEWFDTAARFALTFPLGGDGEKSYFQLDLYLLDGFATLSPYISPFGGAAAESPPPYDSSYDS